MIRRMTEQDKQYIRDNLPHSTMAAVARAIGFTVPAVDLFARKHGIHFSEEAVQKARREAHKNWGPDVHNEEWRRNISEMRKEIFRKERLRDKYGLERKTRCNVRRMPHAIRILRHNLLNYHRYIGEDCHSPESDPYVYYYDDQTRRTSREDVFARMHNMRFLPISEFPTD